MQIEDPLNLSRHNYLAGQEPQPAPRDAPISKPLHAEPSPQDLLTLSGLRINPKTPGWLVYNNKDVSPVVLEWG